MSLGEVRNSHSHKGLEIPHCGFSNACLTRKLMLGLTAAELQFTLDHAPQPILSTMIRSMGFQANIRKKPQLLRARVSTMPSQVLHSLSWVLSVAPMESLVEVVDLPDEDDPDEDGSPEFDLAGALLDGGMARWRERWPPGILRLTLEALWDRSFIDLEERDELMSLVDHPGPPIPHAVPEPTDPAADSPRDGDPVVAQHGVDDEVLGDLERVAQRALDVALAPGATEADLHRQATGLTWLIDLVPNAGEAWFAYGLLTGLAIDLGEDRRPRTPAVQARYTAGRIQGLADGNRQAEVVRLTAKHTSLVEGLLADPPDARFSAAVLGAHLGHPREAARLVTFVRSPFDGWQHFVRQTRTEATRLLSVGAGSEAEVLLRAAEDRLLQWAPLAGAPKQVLVRESVTTSVLRAGCRRRRHDFVGATELLTSLDLAVLTAEVQREASLEFAFAAAELAGIEELSFPRPQERFRWGERLARARPYLVSVLEGDPAQLEANLLLGIADVCASNDADAARHLHVVGERLAAQTETKNLGAAVTFHRALARLRLLEPGIDEGAHRDMEGAFDDGYVPDEAELASAAVALEAHGSPHAGKYLAQAVELAPTSSAVVDLVVDRAKKGDVLVMGLAEAMALEDNRRLIERFDLLTAVLAGVEERHETASAERLAGLIDDVVVRANNPSLDALWAEALESGETLRASLEPAHADAMRMEVLRRAGCLDEALAIATGLFHRAAAGNLHAFDAADLFEVLRELGLDQNRLDALSRLLPKRSEPEVDSEGDRDPALILFVGGNETQEQYRSYLDLEIERRYGDRVSVEWYFSGWSSNWMKVAERINSSLRLRSPDAVVIMTFVRTNFGQWMRRTAGEHGLPWVACTGHGRDAIMRTIDRAVVLSGQPRLG